MADGQRRLILVITTGFDEYQKHIVAGALPILARHGLTLVLNSFDPLERALPPPISQVARGASALGIITTPCTSTAEDEDLSRLLASLRLPTVRIGGQDTTHSSVTGDDVTGMRAVMRHLLDDRRVRHPALVRGLPHQPDSVRREGVFREELAVRGLGVDEHLVVDGHFQQDTAYREIRNLVRRGRTMDAVVAANDLSALGAVKALRDEGLRVPDDILVTGFDNDQVAALSWPGLTTVDPDLGTQGAAAATRLLAEAEGTATGTTQIVVPSRFVVRGSSGPLGGTLAEELAAAVDTATAAQAQLEIRDALRELSKQLSYCRTPETVAATLVDGHLSRLGVSRCFLATYVTDDQAPGATTGPPGPDPALRARLLLDYRNGDRHPVTSEVFPVHRLLPGPLRGELDSGVLVFQPLLAGDRQLGYVLFDQGRGPGLIAEGFRIDLGRSLEAIFSTRELRNHARSLERMVAERTRELQRANAELQRLAMRDGLTWLANRTALQEHLTRQWGQLTRRGGRLALAMADVDLFKAYNDHYGHVQGDRTLQVVATQLAASTRDSEDLACRYGGEEFVLVLPDCDLEGALAVVARFRELLTEAAVPHETSSVAPVVTVSVGIASAPAGPGTDPWSLLERADQALYRAKTQGRDRVCVADESRPRGSGPGVPSQGGRPRNRETPAPGTPSGQRGGNRTTETKKSSI